MEEKGEFQLQVERDIDDFAVVSMVTFLGERIEEIRETVTRTRGLGILSISMIEYLENTVAVHEQMHEWATRVCTVPCPPSEDGFAFLTWITCERLLRRHVAVWRSHEDYWATWLSEEDEDSFEESHDLDEWCERA